MRFSALIPMACAIVAFILSMLCLFAGHKPGFMEEYHIVMLNTSTLGHDLVPSSTSSGASPTATSLGSWLSGVAHNISDSIEDELQDLQDDLVDKLASQLGIKQWYSLHLMDMCEGTFSPNATFKGAKTNVTRCTNQTAMYHFNIDEELNRQLSVGPLNLSLSDLGWSDDIQDGLNALNVALDATFIFYCIGIGAAGLAVLASLVAVFMSGSRLVSLGNFLLAALSFFSLLVSSIIITVLQKKASHIINKYGNDIGVYAYTGKKFLIFTWVSVAVMAVATGVWIAEFIVGRRVKNREWSEKGLAARKTHRMSDDSEFATRRV